MAMPAADACVMTSPPRRNALSEDVVPQSPAHVGVTHCTQYFELSPKPSLDGMSDDENADRNLPSRRTKQGLRTTLGRCSPGRGSPGRASLADSRDYLRQPCLRQQSPTKPGRAETPPRPSRGRVETPSRLRHATASQGDLEDDVRSVISEDMRSITSARSVESRLSQLSRKSISKRILSTQELEQLQIEENKRKLKAQMKKNEYNCRRAISGIGADALLGRGECSMKITIPQEFSFTARTRSRSKSVDKHTHDEAKATTPVTTPRGSVAKASSSKWKPCLQVNPSRGLHTGSSQQQQKQDQKRRSLSCPPEDADKRVVPAARGQCSTNTANSRRMAHEKTKPTTKRETLASQARTQHVVPEGIDEEKVERAARARELACQQLEGQDTQASKGSIQARRAALRLFKKAPAGAGATGASASAATASSSGMSHPTTGMQRSTPTTSAKTISATTSAKTITATASAKALAARKSPRP